MRYFELIKGIYDQFDEGQIYPDNSTGRIGTFTKESYDITVLEFASKHPDHWQEVTEADYLAQQDLLDEFDRHVEGGMKVIQNAPTLGDTFDVMDKLVSEFIGNTELPHMDLFEAIQRITGHDCTSDELNEIVLIVRQTLGDVSGKED